MKSRHKTSIMHIPTSQYPATFNVPFAVELPNLPLDSIFVQASNNMHQMPTCQYISFVFVTLILLVIARAGGVVLHLVYRAYLLCTAEVQQ